MGAGRFGVRSVGLTALAVIGGGVGIYFAFFFKGGSPYTLQETLPQMVSDFGSGARVVGLQVSTDDITYKVIGADGRLHERDYELQFSDDSDGGTDMNRHTTNASRRATAAERRTATVTLGQLSSGIVDKLLSEVGFPKDGSSATLIGNTWTLESGVRAFDKYQARYDGSDLHQTASKATVFASGSSPAGSSSTARPTTAAPTTSIISSGSRHAAPPAGLPGKAGKLLACVQAAHQDVTKIVRCEHRFQP